MSQTKLPNPFMADDDHIARKRRTIASIEGRHGYCPEAVDKAIEAAARRGPRMTKAERNAIHALLKGR